MFVYKLNKYDLRAPQNPWFTLRALFEADKVECYDNVYSLVFTKVLIFHYDCFYILTLVQLILSKPTSINLELNFSIANNMRMLYMTSWYSRFFVLVGKLLQLLSCECVGTIIIQCVSY